MASCPLFDFSATASGQSSDDPADDDAGCTEPHDIEVYALVDLSTISNDFSVSAPFPGDVDVYDAALSACIDRFEAYVGVDYQASVLYIDAFTPTREGWIEVDDRIANCVVFEVNADATEIVQTNRSLRNANR